MESPVASSQPQDRRWGDVETGAAPGLMGLVFESWLGSRVGPRLGPRQTLSRLRLTSSPLTPNTHQVRPLSTLFYEAGSSPALGPSCQLISRHCLTRDQL